MTSAHNFFCADKQYGEIEVKPNDAEFCLQRDGLENYKLLMKVAKVVIYPDYYSDKTFKKGTDIALAVV